MPKPMKQLDLNVHIKQIKSNVYAAIKEVLKAYFREFGT